MVSAQLISIHHFVVVLILACLIKIISLFSLFHSVVVLGSYNSLKIIINRLGLLLVSEIPSFIES